VNRTNASASDNNDAAAVASLFTEDAVLVTDSGPVYGRDAIEKYYTAVFKKSRIGRLPLSEVDRIKIMMAFLFDRLRKLEFRLRPLRQPDSALA
jgi:uncharacterized protein (TIGR02246 family)